MTKGFTVLAAAFLLFGTCVNALGRNVSEAEQPSEEQLLFMEVPVVVTASRMEQPEAQAPSSVSVVTSEEIKKYGYRTLSDILKSIRGFYVTNDRNYEYVGVRGFLRPGDYNTRILLLIDGHRINDNVYDQAYIGTDFPLDVDLIERVEIVRGPGSSLYGSNAFFAVINVITRKGRDFGGAEVSAEAGADEAYKARMSYGKVFGSGIETALSGSYFGGRGEKRLYYKEFDSPATNNGIAEDADSNRSADLFGTFSFKGFTVEGVYSDSKKHVPTASFDTIFDDNRFFTRERHLDVDLRYEHAFPGDLDVMSGISYNYHKYEGQYPLDYSMPGGPPLTVLNMDYGTGEWWGGEFQIAKKLFERHKLVAGAEYRDNFRQEQGNYDIEVYLSDRRHSNVSAVYVEDEVTVFHNLVLNAGVRYDHYSTFGSSTNPRLALIYNPFEKTTFKLIYGTAFRAPNMYELYYNDGGVTQKANPGLMPERLTTYEAICEQSIGGNLRVTADAFYNRIRDLINLSTDPSDNLLVYENIGRVEAQGVELELEGRWKSGLTGRISYTYQQTEDEQTGQALTNSPKHLAKLNLIAPVVRNKVFIGIEEQYMSRRKTIRDNSTNSVYLTNVTLFSQRLVKGLDASASVYNLFDYKYGDPGSDEHIQDIIMQNGRTFRVKLTYRF